MKKQNFQNGYAALMIVIIVGFVAILMVGNLSFTTSYFSKNVLAYERSNEADTLLLSCATVLRQKIAEKAFAPWEEIHFKNGMCAAEVLHETDADVTFNISISVGEITKYADLKIQKSNDTLIYLISR